MAFVYARDRGHDLTGRAVAALESVFVDERLLHGVQAIALCETLHRRNLQSLGANSEGEARQVPLTVNVDRACAALTLIAALFRSGKIDSVAKSIK